MASLSDSAQTSIKDDGQTEDKKLVAGDDDEKEHEVADGGEEMQDEDYEDPPESVHKPPDGGSRAWCVLVSCCSIRFCVIALQNVCDLCVEIIIGKAENKRLQEVLVAVQCITLPMIGIFMTHCGYRVIGLTGSTLIILSLFALSCVPHTAYPLAFYTIYCITGLGFAFLNLISVVPVMEYFQKKRMVALFVYGLSTLVPLIVFEVQLKDHEFTNELVFTIYQLVAMAITCIASSFLVPMALDVEIGEKRVNRILGLRDLSFLKDVLFYLLLVFVYLFHLGISFGNQSQYVYPDKQKSYERIMIRLFPLLGQVVGFVWAVGLRQRAETVVFYMTGAVVLLAAVLTSIVVIPTMSVEIWTTTCFAVLGVAYGLVFMSAHKVIPDLFGKQNTRLIASLVSCMTTLPTLTESLYTDLFGKSSIERFVHAGILILSAGICALVIAKCASSRRTLSISDGDTSQDGDRERDTTEDIAEA